MARHASAAAAAAAAVPGAGFKLPGLAPARRRSLSLTPGPACSGRPARAAPAGPRRRRPAGPGH